MLGINDWHISHISKKVIKLVAVIVIIVMGVWVLLEVDMSALLVIAQRALLFTHTLPMFFDSGRVWFGLGYASNVAYAARQTPYVTYWLDNAYVYYLVTTGVIGLLLLVAALILIAVRLLKNRKAYNGREALSIFCVYLYVSIFETVFFNSGFIVNYMYLPFFLFCTDKTMTKSMKSQSMECTIMQW